MAAQNSSFIRDSVTDTSHDTAYLTQRSAGQNPCESSGPSSLETICCSFIARNMHLVDTFEGLPQVVGELVLKTCFESGVLSHQTESSEKVVSLFVSAYPDEMVTSFHFGRGDRRYIGKFGKFLGDALRSVVELDLCEGKIVADDFLSCLGQFENLERLDLSNNELSNEGLRLLLAKQKVFKSGFVNLKVFSLKGTHLAGSNLQTVLKFPSLQQLEFSVSKEKLITGIEIRDSGPKHGFAFNPVLPRSKTNPKSVRDHVVNAGFTFTADMNAMSFRRSREGQLGDLLGNWIDHFNGKSLDDRKNLAPASPFVKAENSTDGPFRAANFYVKKVGYKITDCLPTKAMVLDHYTVVRTDLNRAASTKSTLAEMDDKSSRCAKRASKRSESIEEPEGCFKKMKLTARDDDIFDLYR